MSDVRLDLENQYIVVVFGEKDLLSNLLSAMAVYRAKVGHVPATVVVNEKLILDIDLRNIDIVRKSWPLRDALYMSTYRPQVLDACDCRIPTTFNEVRRAV